MSNIKLTSCHAFLLGVILLFPGWGLAADNQVRAVQASLGKGEVVSFSLPINVPEAFLYAGPGSNFYTTGKLTQNTQVEIFLRRPDGWCAVRPPEGSFSWINANFVRRENDQLGIITQHETDKEVPIRVGTDSVVKSSVIQVGLKNGKRVRILGETKLPGGAAWYKIVPPAGEFRWIQDNVLLQDDTIKQLPAKITMTREYLDSYMEAKSPVPVAVPQQNAKTPESLPPQVSSMDPKQGAQTANIAKIPATLPDPQQGISENNASTPDGTARQTTSLPFSIPPINNATNNTNALASGTDEYSMEIARVNRDLFEVVNGRGNLASLDILSDRAKALFNAANSDEQRLAAKNIHVRIEQIKSRQTNSQTGNLAAIGPQGSITAQPGETSEASKDKRFIKPRQRIVRPEKTNDSHRLGFAFSSKNKSPHPVQTVAPSAPVAANSVKTGDTAPVPSTKIADTRTEGHSLGRGKPIFGTSPGPTTVPPHDYQMIAPPPMVLPGPDNRGTSVPTQDKPRQDKTSTSEKPTFLAEGQKPVLPGPALAENASIRQVSATVSDPTASAPGLNNSSVNRPHNVSETQHDDINSWQPPASLTQGVPQKMIPIATTTTQTAPISSGQKSLQGFDAMGILGHLPAKPQGYPPYVLVEKNGEQMNIICYVQAESGQSLDRFVGKTIGVKGTRGWLKGEGESRMVLTAKTIFALR